MLKITRKNVNDRISTRMDNVMSILASDFLGNLLLNLRCLAHQMRSAFSFGIGHPNGAGYGHKRYAFEPVRLPSPVMPRKWRSRATTTTTARGTRSA